MTFASYDRQIRQILERFLIQIVCQKQNRDVHSTFSHVLSICCILCVVIRKVEKNAVVSLEMAVTDNFRPNHDIFCQDIRKNPPSIFFKGGH